MMNNISYFEARRVSPEDYDKYKIPIYLKNRLPVNKDANILDFGCGFGQVLRELEALGYKNAIGAEIDQKAIEYCKKRGFKVEDVSNLDSFLEKYENYFDMIIMNHVLEHFPKEKIIPTLSKLKNTLKKGGSIFIAVPNAQSNTGAYWAYEDFTHSLIFTSGSIYYVLKMAGFDDIEFVDIECLEGLKFPKKLLKNFYCFFISSIFIFGIRLHHQLFINLLLKSLAMR